MWVSVCLVVALALACVEAAPKTHVLPMHKHHGVHPKLDPRRWITRSNERRAQRGIKPMSMNAWRRRSSSKRVDPSLPTGGDLWPVAIYWSFVNVGTPAVQFPVAIDSGSFTLDIPLVGCNGCTQQPPNNAYNPKNSNTSNLFTCSLFKSCTPGGASCEHDQCTFSNTYETCVPTDPTQPCTISGLWYQDLLTWGNSGSVAVQFGAINYQTSNFEQFQNINGVVGMAGPNNPQSVIGQLASGGAIDQYVWSICLQPGAVSNGTITVGGIDSRLYKGSIVYTPNTGQDQYYQMQVNAMTVGGKQIFIDEQQVIMDSGTNILLLPDESYSSMKQILLSMCSTTKLHGICDVRSGTTLFDNVCYTFTAAQVMAFPNITISVPNIDLVITPNNYILLNYGVNGQPGQYCLGVASTGQGGLFIVGDTLLMNYYTVFDQTNQQLGWAPVSSTCGNIRA